MEKIGDMMEHLMQKSRAQELTRGESEEVKVTAILE